MLGLDLFVFCLLVGVDLVSFVCLFSIVMAGYFVNSVVWFVIVGLHCRWKFVWFVLFYDCCDLGFCFNLDDFVGRLNDVVG